MPNHVHGIIEIIDNYVIGIDVGTGLKPVPTSIVPTPATVVNVLGHSLSEIIRGFKTFSSRRINEIVFFRWQRSFYDRIIRDADAYQKIKLYIQDNPINWELDRNNPFNHHV
jgi:REP element-mobilizing transposase RayT